MGIWTEGVVAYSADAALGRGSASCARRPPESSPKGPPNGGRLPGDSRGGRMLEAPAAAPGTVAPVSDVTEQKARRILTDGRLTVEAIDRDTGFVLATVVGSSDTYRCGYDPARVEWRCTCPAFTTYRRGKRCSHLIALQLVALGPVHAGVKV